MKTSNFLLLLMVGISLSSELFSQEVGEIVPCKEILIMCSQIHPAENVIRNNGEYQKLLNTRSPVLAP